MPIIGLVVGAAIGLWLDRGFDALLAGAFIGLIAGLIVGAFRKRTKSAIPAADGATVLVSTERLASMEFRLARVEAALERAGLTATPAAIVAPTPASEIPSATTDETPTIAPPPEPAYARATGVTLAAAGVAPVIPTSAPPFDIPAPPVYDAKPNPIWAWIMGGNTLARVGIIVLFIGVGFLLKYASEHYTVPVELRIAAVALGGVALLIVGWRLRARRTAYAMILQGGGVGVLYLTVFAALKLYALLPPGAAFALLFWIAALSSWLAIRQDSIALAAVGVIGGFLAPVLTATQSGNHVLLFSYYALLNAGIFAIAWFKAWRLLNLLGFVCTFIVGTAWGVTRYRAADFSTTEPFLVLFFLFYVGIAVLYALRRSVEVKHYVDGTIVFGTPLVAAGLQNALVHPFEFGMAGSAVAAAAVYLGLARILWARRRDDLRLLVESFLALGVVFATLAVPLAFDARWTSATWALEGAAIVWVGVRQRHLAPRVFGLLLQLAAGGVFWLGWNKGIGHASAGALLILNSEFVGAALVAAAGLVTAWVLHRAEELRAWERTIIPVAFAWGVVWWAIAGIREIDRFVVPDVQLAAIVVFLSTTALAFAFVARRLAWQIVRVPALLLIPLLLVIAVGAIARGDSGGWHLFAHGGILAWGFALLICLLLLRAFDGDAAAVGESWVEKIQHAGLVWLVALVAAHELAWFAAQYVSVRGVWRVVPWGLVPSAVLLALCALAARTSWPVGAHRRTYLVVGAVPLVVWMLVFALVGNFASDGNPAPLPFVPILNPLDLTLGFVALSLALWVLALRREGVEVRTAVPREALFGIPAVLAFVWANALVLRTVHHWHAVPWTFDGLWQSTLVQAVLSLLWSVIALATMVYANRSGARTAWVAGATLLGVVVLKLFAVDLSRVGGIERIVSFIGVGALLLLIGYLAPVPPRRKEEAS
jgi:uncharacterized membrane protein